jgi:hypothetical protein
MTMLKLLRVLVLMLAAAVFAIPVARADQPSATTTFEDLRVERIAGDGLSLDCVALPQATPMHLVLGDQVLQDRVKELHAGDHVSALIATDTAQPTLRTLSVRAVGVGVRYRAEVILGSAFAFWLVCFLLSGFHPQKLIMGEDGRFSNSKFQTVIWFGIVVISYLATFFMRWRILGGDMLGGINIPQNLFLLSGMSALTFTAAKGITVAKIQSAEAAGIVNVKPFATAARFWSDLTSNDSNQFDLGDFQMLAMTFLAVGTFTVLMFHFLGSLEARTLVNLPDVDTTILASFGLGHGAYLTKKAVGTVGNA